MNDTEQKPEDIQCPACGYYCLGNGGFGCIDKPFLVESQKNQPTAQVDGNLDEILKRYSLAVQGLHAGVKPIDDGIEANRYRQEAKRAIAAHLQAAIQTARIDELQRIIDSKATLNDIYGDNPRNNYGYNETQVRDAVNWLRNRHNERLQQLKKEASK